MSESDQGAPPDRTPERKPPPPPLPASRPVRRSIVDSAELAALLQHSLPPPTNSNALRKRISKELIGPDERQAYRSLDSILYGHFNGNRELFAETFTRYMASMPKRVARAEQPWQLSYFALSSNIPYATTEYLNSSEIQLAHQQAAELDDKSTSKKFAQFAKSIWPLGKKQEIQQQRRLVPSLEGRRGLFATLFLHIIEGVNMGVNPAREKAGKLGEFYCRLYIVSVEGKRELDAQQFVGATTRSTNSAPDSLEPVWDAVFVLPVDHPSDCLLVDVFDQMGTTQSPHKNDPLMGRVCVPMVDVCASQTNIGNATAIHNWFHLFTSTLKQRVAGSVNMRLALDEALETEDTLLRRVEAFRSFPAPEPATLPLTIFVGTWNVGNAMPPDDLSPWIPVGSHDLYVIGTQECKYPPRLGYSSCKEDWRAHLVRHFGRDYTLVCMKSLWEIRLAVFVRNSLKFAIGGISIHKQATGIGNVLGNKGGTVISFWFNTTHICFVSAHLAAHHEQTQERNQNIRDILKHSKVGPPRQGCGRVLQPDLINQFDHIFFFGDLNYRVDTGDENCNTPSLETHVRICHQIELPSARQELAEQDQLRKEMSNMKTFCDFQEGNLAGFRPTFKVIRHVNPMRYDFQRAPAWCDRILWRSLPGRRVDHIEYDSVESIVTSDHKPVLGSFVMHTKLPASALTVGVEKWSILLSNLSATGLTSVEQRRFESSAQAKGAKHMKARLMKELREMKRGEQFPAMLCFTAPFLPQPLVTPIATTHTWRAAYRYSDVFEESRPTSNASERERSPSGDSGGSGASNGSGSGSGGGGGGGGGGGAAGESVSTAYSTSIGGSGSGHGTGGTVSPAVPSSPSNSTNEMSMSLSLSQSRSGIGNGMGGGSSSSSSSTTGSLFGGARSSLISFTGLTGLGSSHHSLASPSSSHSLSPPAPLFNPSHPSLSMTSGDFSSFGTSLSPMDPTDLCYTSAARIADSMMWVEVLNEHYESLAHGVIPVSSVFENLATEGDLTKPSPTATPTRRFSTRHSGDEITVSLPPNASPPAIPPRPQLGINPSASSTQVISPPASPRGVPPPLPSRPPSHHVSGSSGNNSGASPDKMNNNPATGSAQSLSSSSSSSIISPIASSPANNNNHTGSFLASVAGVKTRNFHSSFSINLNYGGVSAGMLKGEAFFQVQCPADR